MASVLNIERTVITGTRKECEAFVNDLLAKPAVIFNVDTIVFVLTDERKGARVGGSKGSRVGGSKG